MPDYADIGAELFNRIAALTGKSNRVLAETIGPKIGRPRMDRQLMARWRTGKSQVPVAAFLAMMDMEAPPEAIEVIRSIGRRRLPGWPEEPPG